MPVTVDQNPVRLSAGSSSGTVVHCSADQATGVQPALSVALTEKQVVEPAGAVNMADVDVVCENQVV